MRLHPHYDEWVPVRLAFSLVAQEKYDEAEELFTAVITSGKSVRQPVQSLEGMAVIAIFKGEMEKARDYIVQLLELNPQFSITATKGRNGFMKDQAFLKRYLDALRQAGLPEKGKQQS
jgi:Tfp pilus assembly protein PilF